MFFRFRSQLIHIIMLNLWNEKLKCFLVEDTAGEVVCASGEVFASTLGEAA